MASGSRVASISGVCEVDVVGRGPPSVLIEIPHGATRRVELDALSRRLVGRLPERIEAAFFVGTDAGAPECGRSVAEMLGAMGIGVQVLRSLIPRTFVDCNRQLAGPGPDASKLTAAMPELVTDREDRLLLASLHADYQEVADAAFDDVCGRGGRALMLHTYAPKSIEVDPRMGEGVVEQLLAAYEPATYERWKMRPEVDLVTKGPDRAELADPVLVGAAREEYRAIGIEPTTNRTYFLHPAMAAHRRSIAHPRATLCLEIRRDLLADPFSPFEEMHISPTKVSRMARPLARAVARALGVTP